MWGVNLVGGREGGHFRITKLGGGFARHFVDTATTTTTAITIINNN